MHQKHYQANWIFIGTALCFLLLAYVVSGERFLDWVFNIPNWGWPSDTLIDMASSVQSLKDEIVASSPLPDDLFGRLRENLHRLTGLE